MKEGPRERREKRKYPNLEKIGRRHPGELEEIMQLSEEELGKADGELGEKWNAKAWPDLLRAARKKYGEGKQQIEGT